MRAIVGLFLIFGFCACDFGKKTNESHEKDLINWYKGSIEEALAEAKETDRPLFVYWGAKWCPPCNLLKSTAFKNKDFAESTKKFISVYLDGDTESAQKWGEKLIASGYPTLMVLNSAGEEVVRINTTMSSQVMADTLDAAYENLNPISEVINRIIAKGPREGFEAADWQYLANYSWLQDTVLEEKKGGIASILGKLEAKVPRYFDEEKSRLFLNYIVAMAQEREKKKQTGLPRKLLKKGRKRLSKILNSDVLVKFNMEFLSYYSSSLITGLYPKKGKERDQVIDLYNKAMDKARDLPGLEKYKKLVSFYPIVELRELKLRTKEFSEKEKAVLKKEMLDASSGAKGAMERIYTTNSTTYILYKANMGDLARKILEDDLKAGVNDYYTMSSMAWIEKESGNKKEALSWADKAYKASQGTATRIQWGATNIHYMVDLAPKDKTRIIDQLDDYYAKNLAASDAFMGRNKRTLEKLGKKIKVWSKAEKVDTKIKSIFQKHMAECQKKSESKTQSYINDCKNYFEKLM